MSSYILSEINIYPVKSLSGISLQNCGVTDRGFKHDRRWMIINEEEKFVTQRTHPQLALIKTKISGNKLILGHKLKDIAPLVIPINLQLVETAIVNVWDDFVEARMVGKYSDEWLSEILKMKCKLVFMPDESERYVNRNYSFNNEIVSFADAFPFMMIGQSSLDDLNSRLTEKLPMNRFRPNLVFSGGKPYEEDKWQKIKIGGIEFNVVKPCSRCVTINVNQDNAEKGEEPLKTLAKYRSEGNKIYFGQNLLHNGNGILKVGDEIEILEWK
jgi:uncharacterized protein YcbX